jgi:hypothetical protein
MHTIDDIVDATFVRNLKRRDDRMPQISKELDRVGIKWDRFPAVDHINTDKSAMFLNAASLRSMIYLAQATKLKAVLLLDDDVYFHKDFNVKFDEFYQQIPSDWDSISLASIFRDDWSNQEFVSPLVIRSYESWGGHATIIRSTSYKKYIEVVDGADWADVSTSKLYSHIKHYVAYPSLAGQREGNSDLTNTYRANDYYGIDVYDN